MEDEQIALNIYKLRAEMSQSELALKMRDAGHPWQQKTVYLVEKAERSLRLSEAVDLAKILGVPMSALIGEPDIETPAQTTWVKAHNEFYTSKNMLDMTLPDYMQKRERLAALLDAYEGREWLEKYKTDDLQADMSLTKLIHKSLDRIMMKQQRSYLAKMQKRNPAALLELFTGIKSGEHLNK